MKILITINVAVAVRRSAAACVYCTHVSIGASTEKHLALPESTMTIGMEWQFCGSRSSSSSSNVASNGIDMAEG